MRCKAAQRGFACLIADGLYCYSPFDESGDRYWGTRTAALQLPTQDSIAILQAAETILAGIFRDGKVYKKAGNIDKPMLATTSKNGGQSSRW